jgi:hypothetical protein
LRNVGVLIREKVWLRLFSSQNFSRINTPKFLKPSHSSHLHAYEDGAECSETLSYKLQTPGNYPEESIQNGKFKFHSNRIRMKDTLHEDQYIFSIISRSYILRMRNVSHKFVQKIKLQSLCSVTLLKIVAFMR